MPKKAKTKTIDVTAEIPYEGVSIFNVDIGRMTTQQLTEAMTALATGEYTLVEFPKVTAARVGRRAFRLYQQAKQAAATRKANSLKPKTRAKRQPKVSPWTGQVRTGNT